MSATGNLPIDQKNCVKCTEFWSECLLATPGNLLEIIHADMLDTMMKVKVTSEGQGCDIEGQCHTSKSRS